jgi:predicted O-methyltransferase YrrM
MKKHLWTLGTGFVLGAISLFFYAKNHVENQTVPQSKEVAVSLPDYLRDHGFQLSPQESAQSDRFVTDKQKEQFKEQLSIHPYIASIAEIGLNAGNSAEHFLKCCPALKKFVSFDINKYPYTAHAVEYFTRYYKGFFEFVPGDSAFTVSEYAKKFPEQKFDLIYIDGDHSYESSMSNLIRCKDLAHSNSLVWINDYNFSDVQRAVVSLQDENFLEIDSIHRTAGDQGERYWACVRYR